MLQNFKYKNDNYKSGEKKKILFGNRENRGH